MSALTTRMQSMHVRLKGGECLSDTLSDTSAHDPCEYDEDGFNGKLLVAIAGDSSSSMAGEVVATSGVGLDDVSVSKLRQACAQSGASAHEARVRATSTLSTPILHATFSLVEHEGAFFFLVRWEDPSAKTCRPISLEKYNRIMHNVPFVIPVVSVLGCRFVVADTGAQMFKGTRPPRHQMPMWCRDVQRAQTSNNLDRQVSANQCVVCEISLRAVVADSDVHHCKQ